MATPETTPELDVQTAEDGQEEKIDWEKRFKDTQAELTRVKQALKTQDQPDDETELQWQQFEQEAQKRGFVKADDLKRLEQSLEQKKRLETLLEDNPDLKKHVKAIEAIARAENKAYEDIIEEYGFGTKDALAKARARGPMGDRPLNEKQKSYKDLTPAEREALRKERKKDGLTVGRTL